MNGSPRAVRVFLWAKPPEPPLGRRRRLRLRLRASPRLPVSRTRERAVSPAHRDISKPHRHPGADSNVVPPHHTAPPPPALFLPSPRHSGGVTPRLRSTPPECKARQGHSVAHLFAFHPRRRSTPAAPPVTRAPLSHGS